MIRAALVLTGLLMGVCQAQDAGERPPNIILVMVDDMGWTDVGCQGNDAVDTPNIDKLAAQGVRFTNAYAASPVCSPVRAAILTGKAPARLRITNHIPDQQRFTPDGAVLEPAAMLDHLPLEHVTIAEHLRGRGFATAMLGKWHLAGERRGKDGLGDVRFYPEAQGFDRNLGGCAYGGPPTFFDPYRIHNLPSRKQGEYLPDRLADESCMFLAENRDRPFFLCLWPYALHWPMEAPAELIAKYQERSGPGIKDPRYAAMTEAFDRAFGRILDALDRAGIADETLIILTSDNGPYLGVAEPRPLRLGKGYLYEGGIRVPMIIRWPAVVQPGRVSEAPVISMDVLPTVLEACGLRAADGTPCDGESLMPLLRGDGELSRDALFWHYPNYAFHRGNRLGAAIRVGALKLIENFDDGSVELYDLGQDIGEADNLAATRPDQARRLQLRLRAWLKAVDAQMPRRLAK